MYDLPGYVWALVLVGVVGIPVGTCAVLYRGAIRARLGRGRAGTVAGGAAAVLGGWLAASALLAGSGVSLRRLAAAARAERRTGAAQPLPVSG